MLDQNPQLAREKEMADRGQRRASAITRKALERGEAIETPGGLQLARRAIEPMANAIREFVTEAFSGRAVRRGHAANMLKGVDPELAAFVTIRVALGSAARGATLKSVAYLVADRLELELIADAFEKKEGALYRSVVRQARSRGLPMARVGKAVGLANKHFNVVDGSWTYQERIHLGVKLIELMIQKVGVITYKLLRRSKTRITHYLELTPEADAWMKKYNQAATLTRPVFLPTLTPPKPWDGIKGGAYYSPILRGGAIITKHFRGQLDALGEAEMPAVYKGLNGIQATPWRINRRVLEVMQQVWGNALPGFPLPAREDEPIPEATQEVIDDEKGGPHRRAFRRLRRQVHERNAKARASRFEFDRALSIAAENADEPSIYFPHRLDFRGRCYASATSLNPQGPDEVRALLEFGEGKPLGDTGLKWLAIHGANLFGFDKVSLEQRAMWAWANIDKIDAVATDPLGQRWWTEADKPWSFLAWCFEWSRGVDNPDFISHLPIALDGSCNGIQHYSAMLRDPIGGAAVNLVPSDKPQDIYAEVAQAVTRKLSDGMATEGPDQWIHDAWFQFGIDRKITKRAVMVLPYGGTFASCLEYVRAAVQDHIAAGQDNPFGDELDRAIKLLAGLVWRSIGDVVIAARAGMSWLQKVARVATRNGVPLRWTTPSGFVVCQEYREMSKRRIETRFCGNIVRFRSIEETNVMDEARQCLAVAPNFVHSLDASAMMLTVSAALDRGIGSFAMIHDSYGTHAADTEALAQVLRETFVGMYEDHDVLREFRDELAARLPPGTELPELPATGTLNLKEVLTSNYFFA